MTIVGAFNRTVNLTANLNLQLFEKILFFLRRLADKSNAYLTRFYFLIRLLLFSILRLSFIFSTVLFALSNRLFSRKFFIFYTFLYIVAILLDVSIATKILFDKSVLQTDETNYIGTEAAHKLYFRLKQQKFNLLTTETTTQPSLTTSLLINQNQSKHTKWNKVFNFNQNLSTKLSEKNNNFYLTTTSTTPTAFLNPILTLKAITKFPLILPLINRESILFQVIQQVRNFILVLIKTMILISSYILCFIYFILDYAMIK